MFGCLLGLVILWPILWPLALIFIIFMVVHIAFFNKDNTNSNIYTGISQTNVRDRKYNSKWEFFKDYGEYLKTPQWLAKRESVLLRDGYRCTECGSQLDLRVHHLNYKKLYDEDVSDLKTLCKNCHDKKHPRKKSKKPPF